MPLDMNAPFNARAALKKKLEEAFTEQWDDQRPTRAEIIEDDGGLGLALDVQSRDGTWHRITESPVKALMSQEDVDDLLAENLSMFLEKHYAWPR